MCILTREKREKERIADFRSIYFLDLDEFSILLEFFIHSYSQFYFSRPKFIKSLQLKLNNIIHFHPRSNVTTRQPRLLINYTFNLILKKKNTDNYNARMNVTRTYFIQQTFFRNTRALKIKEFKNFTFSKNNAITIRYSR